MIRVIYILTVICMALLPLSANASNSSIPNADNRDAEYQAVLGFLLDDQQPEVQIASEAVSATCCKVCSKGKACGDRHPVNEGRGHNCVVPS